MGIEKENKYPIYIAIPHTRRAERWYLTLETQPDKEEGDMYILGDHDLHNILRVESREELEALREYNGHQWAAVRAIVEDICEADGDGI